MTKSSLLRSASERKFTPPTEFPAEYVTEGGQKAVILGKAPVGDYPLIGYILHAEDGSDWPDCSSSEGWTEDGQYHIDWSSPSEGDLHDIPKRITTWHNVYKTWLGLQCAAREYADACKDGENRLCVYRIERDEDGGNPEIFVEEV